MPGVDSPTKFNEQLRPVSVSGLEAFLDLLVAKLLANMPSESEFHADTGCWTHLGLLDLIFQNIRYKKVVDFEKADVFV